MSSNDKREEADEYIMTEAEAEALRDTSNKNLPKIPVRQLRERHLMNLHNKHKI